MFHPSSRCSSFSHFLAPATLALLLSACGGGGGGGGDNPPGTDAVPDAVIFAAMKNAAPGFVYLSEAKAVAGMSEGLEASIGISGANCAFAINDGAFGKSAGKVGNGDTLRIRGKAADAFEKSTKCTLDIGGVKSAFEILTGKSSLALNVTPGKLDFSWGKLAGVTRFELTRHNHVTGESAIAANDIDGKAKSFSLPISVHLTDWINDRFLLSACNEQGCVTLPDHAVDLVQAMSAQAVNYLKGTIADPNSYFGDSIAMEGNLLAVGAWQESTAADNAGAVHVFRRDDDGIWNEEAFLNGAPDNGVIESEGFGYSVSLSGNRLAVGAPLHLGGAGHVYVFHRDEAGSWTQEADLDTQDLEDPNIAGLGAEVVLSEDLLFVGLPGEVNSGNGLGKGGMVLVSERDDASGWVRKNYLTASNAEDSDFFGLSIAFDGEDLLAIGAPEEDSAAKGVDKEQNDNTARESGAVYLFRRDGSGNWIQEAYIKASNTGGDDRFGESLALSGTQLVVGAPREDGDANDSDNNSGAVYVFNRDEAEGWIQTAYLKAPDPIASDRFGSSVALSGDTLAIAATGEGSNATGMDGDQANNDMAGSGAVYLFRRNETGEWKQQSYVKASNTGADDEFGGSVALSGDTLVVGAPREDSNATGINGDQANDETEDSGAVYVY